MNADLRLDEVRTRILVGAPPGALTGLPERAVRALSVSTAVGAPGVVALDAAIAARDDQRRRDRALEVATAQARAVALGLAALPLLVIPGLSVLLDQPLWRFYLTPPGVAVAAVGLGLAGGGAILALRLVAAARRPPRPRPLMAAVAIAVPLAVIAGPPAAVLAGGGLAAWRRWRRPPPPGPPGLDEVADLVATALAGGDPPTAALRVVADVLPDPAAELRRAALALELGLDPATSPGLDRIVSVLTAAARWGAPAGPPLRRVAAEFRAVELTRALAAAERLPAVLAFPTTLCLLPACVLLVGAPLLAAGLAAAGAAP